MNDYYAYTSGGVEYYIYYVNEKVTYPGGGVLSGGIFYGISANLKAIKNGKIIDYIIYDFDPDGEYYSFYSDHRVNPSGHHYYVNEQKGLITSESANATQVWNIINSREFKKLLK